METEAHKLLDAVEEEGAEGAEKAAPVHHSETAMRHMEEYDTIKSTIGELHEKIEVEAGSITQDQKYYAEFFQGVKSFKPWMDEAEKVANAPLHKPETLEDAKKLMETTIAFEAGCQENRATWTRRSTPSPRWRSRPSLTPRLRLSPRGGKRCRRLPTRASRRPRSWWTHGESSAPSPPISLKPSAKSPATSNQTFPSWNRSSPASVPSMRRRP